MVRDIIDIDSNYEDFEAQEDDEEIKNKKKSKSEKEKNEDEKKQEEGTPTKKMTNLMFLLLKWKKIKPKIINILISLNKNYLKLKKYQFEN